MTTTERDAPHASTLVATHGGDGDQAGAAAVTPLAHVARYADPAPLGHGGMGEVLAVRDRQIGRDIAIKRLLGPKREQAGVRARFVREARVQAQLEHPAIVPVYDLGVDDDGDTWFTMKRIRGETLKQIIDALRAGDPDAVAKHSRRRLLTAFSSVCLAIDFAHSRGVVHRDLKPSNLMFGDFGEVYVLDWGIAKIAGMSDADLLTAPLEGAAAEAAPQTEVGEVLGTLGYMAPEQLLGMHDEVGPRSDVWALGAILFELLALEPLLPRMTLGASIASSGGGFDARPSVRAPHHEIVDELDAICARATAGDPADRYPSARALHDDLERFLDGARDLERRRAQSADHVRRAEGAEREAGQGGADALAQRTLAMREVNRALALDPTSEPAQQAMVRLLATPPATLPVDARAELTAAQHAEIRFGFRIGAIGFLSMYLFMPIYLWMGIRDWTLTSAALAMIAASSGAMYWGARYPERARGALWAAVVTSGVLIAVLTRVVGPFAVAPVLAFGMSIGLIFNPMGLGVRGMLVFVTIALVAPIALELAGVIEPSYRFVDGSIRIVPHMTELPELPTSLSLTMTTVTTFGLVGLYLARMHAMLVHARERLWIQSWNARQFLPDAIPGRAAAR